MADSKKLKALLDKYAAGTCTPQEVQLLELWVLRIKRQEAPEALSEQEQAAILQSITTSPAFHRRVASSRWIHWRKIAVAASILLLFSLTLYLLKDRAGSPAADATFLQVSTGQDELKKVQLPDGSEVWLNAKTELRYLPGFRQHRQVELSGEAYFDVKPDRAHPFRITTADSVEITVLGTRFNVRSYASLSATAVAVEEGSVRVQKGPMAQQILRPGEALRVAKQSIEGVRYAAHAPGVATWREGIWPVGNLGLEELQLLLHNHYGITLLVPAGSSSGIALNANFNRRQSPDELLRTYCLLAQCSYRWIDEQTIELND